MSPNFTTKSYVIFLFLLPLIFVRGINDMVLLPRQLLLSAFVALLLFVVFKNRDKNQDASKWDAVSLAMVGYLAISTVVSLTSATVISESLYGLSKLWIVISFLLLTLHLLKTETITTNQIVNAIILFGGVAIVITIIDMSDKTLRGKHLFRNIENITGNFANKNLLSSILFLCLPFFLIGCQQKKALKWLSGLALILALAILLMIRTRTVLVAVLVFFGIVALFYLRRLLNRKSWWAVVIGLVAAIGVVPFVFGSITGGLQSSSDIKQQYFYRIFSTNTIKERLLFWQNSIEMFWEHPFGVGIGNWPIHFPKYGLEKFGSFEIQNGLHTLQRPHNDFLGVLCETGILGFAAFVFIVGMVVYQLVSLIRTAPTQQERQMFVYLLSALIGFVVIAFFDFPMERIEHQVILFLLFAIVIDQYRKSGKSGFTCSVSKKWLGLFVAVGICLSLTIAFRRLQSEREAYDMQLARKNSNTKEVLWCARQAENNFFKIDANTMPLKWYEGTAYFAGGEFSKSERCFTAAFALTPYNINVINNLASCYEVSGKRDDAIEMYAKALQISPRFEEARLNLAAVYFNKKAFDKAFETIDRCAIDTRDAKYKTFLSPILKAKADLILQGTRSEVSEESKNILANLQDYTPIYFESKKNNITFEEQIIKYLNK